jgi:hypothetical protein
MSALPRTDLGQARSVFASEPQSGHFAASFLDFGPPSFWASGSFPVTKYEPL